MLDGLDAVPWQTFHYADYVCDVPTAIRNLLSEDAAVREEALAAIAVMVEYDCGGGVDTMSPQTVAAAIPFLLEVLPRLAVSDAAALLLALMDFAAVPDADVQRAVRDGIPVLLTLLAEGEPLVRVRAAIVLAELKDDAAMLLPTLDRRLSLEENELARGAILYAISRLTPHTPATLALARTLFQHDPGGFVRFIAALSLTESYKYARRMATDDAPIEAPTDAITFLVYSLVAPAPYLNQYDQMRDTGAGIHFVSIALAHLPDAFLRPHAPVLIEALRHPATRFTMLDVAEQLVSLLFAPSKDGTTLSLAHLDAERRAALAALAGYDPIWGSGNVISLLSCHGLPTKREDLRAFLGITAS